ncbi:MAG: PEP-CTERM sorting domain-containing protein, partial [Phycisphaerae bacterium]
FVPTASNGVYAVRSGALDGQIDTANVQAYDVIKLDPALYTHDMGQFDGEVYKLLDNNGVPIGGSGNSKLIDLNNAFAIRGMAQTKDRMVGVMNPGFQEWNNQQYADGIIPEPGTVALLLAGGSLLALAKGRCRQEKGTCRQ